MSSALRKPPEPTPLPTPEVFEGELQPGTLLLHGQFVIDAFLNSGGFGMTYLARDAQNRRVVIKECFPEAFCRRSTSVVVARSRADQAGFRSAVNRFVQEAVSLSKLTHPNIVAVHQVFEDNDTAYMSMDHIEGHDLLDTLEDSARRLAPAQITGILTGILDAVGFIHRKGVLHRDISPDNILLCATTGKPVLIDFGAARDLTGKTGRAHATMRMVKDGYSPQEFYLQDGEEGPSSDLYALGATFYHLIRGKAPVNAQLRLAAVTARIADPYEPLLGRVSGYPDAFLAAIDRALSLFPKDRIASAEDWLAILKSSAPATKRGAMAARRLDDRASVRVPAKSGKSLWSTLVASATMFGVVAGFALPLGHQVSASTPTALAEDATTLAAMAQ
jgi:serine/threonine protein kinase